MISMHLSVCSALHVVFKVITLSVYYTLELKRCFCRGQHVHEPTQRRALWVTVKAHRLHIPNPITVWWKPTCQTSWLGLSNIIFSSFHIFFFVLEFGHTFQHSGATSDLLAKQRIKNSSSKHFILLLSRSFTLTNPNSFHVCFTDVVVCRWVWIDFLFPSLYIVVC